MCKRGFGPYGTPPILRRIMLGMSGPLLDVCDIRKRYGRLDALAGVSFAIDEGELFGLLGPNGAGKSTLLGILAGLNAATSGAVQLGGRRVAPENRDVRRQIGIAPQSLALYPDLSARENLQFFGRLYEMPATDLEQRVDEVLAAIGLTERANDRVGTYSGGMQRRLNLGAAVLHRPRIVFLDEPTVGVDPQSRAHIFDEVRRLNAAGTTVVYTSHYMEEVQSLCRRVGILDRGRLIACDSVPNLLRTSGGDVRLHVIDPSELFRNRLSAISGASLSEVPGQFVLHCDDLSATVGGVLDAIRSTDANVTDLRTQEPNLERVFLSLTGRDLRD